MTGPITDAAYTAMVKEQAQAAAGAIVDRAMAIFLSGSTPSLEATMVSGLRETLKASFAEVWTLGHNQAMRDVNEQQKQVLESIKKANDSLEVVVKQRNALRDQLLALRRKGIR